MAGLTAVLNKHTTAQGQSILKLSKSDVRESSLRTYYSFFDDDSEVSIDRCMPPMALIKVISTLINSYLLLTYPLKINY